GQPVPDVLASRSARAELSEEPERPLPSRPLPALARECEEGRAGTAARAHGGAGDDPRHRGPRAPRAAEGRGDPLTPGWAERPMAAVRSVWNTAAFLYGARLTGHQAAASLTALAGGVGT